MIYEQLSSILFSDYKEYYLFLAYWNAIRLLATNSSCVFVIRYLAFSVEKVINSELLSSRVLLQAEFWLFYLS